MYDLTEAQKITCTELLETQTQAMGFAFTATQIEQLIRYASLFFKWNRTYNLTSVRNIHSLINRHIVDSLSLLPYIDDAKRLLDVGSGAGLPGIPVAIVRPDIMVALLDANGKKACFLRQVVNEMNLKNVGILQQRVEDYHPQKPFDIVTARAFSSVQQLVELTRQCTHDRSKIIAMKGMYPSAELDELSIPYEVIELSMPCEELQYRHLVIIDHAQTT